MNLLENLSWIAPEIYISFSVVSLILYGVIGEKTTEARKYSQQQKITWLSIMALTIAAMILLDQISMISHNYISLNNGIIGINEGVLEIKLVIIASTIIILAMSNGMEGRDVHFEWSQLILLSVLGMLITVQAKDLITLYLGIELLSLSLYSLASSKRTGKYSTEAGLKYFILGALSSGVLLFGMGLIYISTSQTGYSEILALSLGGEGLKPILSIGGLMIVISLLFKLAAAPFHMWAPDVYEGSPTIVTAFFAIVPKIAILGALFNLVFGALIGIFDNLQTLLLSSCILSIFVGSIGALNQTKIKRLLAYSAIAHIGFVLMGFVPGTLFALQASFVYMFIYILMSINSFSVVLSTFQNQELESNPTHFISQFIGLSRKNSVLAINFALLLLSIAGIPPLAGFLSKFLVLNYAIDAHFYLLSILAVIFSVIGSYYYLRIIKWSYFRSSSTFFWKLLHDAASPYSSINILPAHSYFLGFTFFAILTLLLYPFPILYLSFDAIIHLFLN